MKINTADLGKVLLWTFLLSLFNARQTSHDQVKFVNNSAFRGAYTLLSMCSWHQS